MTLTVSDGYSDDSDEVIVTVADTTPPELTVTVDPDVLWPPNHQLVDVTATVAVADVCDPSPTFSLDAVSSSEPDNATGDGNTTGDIEGADIGTTDLAFRLRSERRGSGDGRTYTLRYSGSDASGNATSADIEVLAPHHP